MLNQKELQLCCIWLMERAVPPAARKVVGQHQLSQDKSHIPVNKKAQSKKSKTNIETKDKIKRPPQAGLEPATSSLQPFFKG